MIHRDKEAVAAFYRQLGARIADARTRADLTQYALARAIGVSRPSIGNIELGYQSPPLHVLLAICEIVGVPLAVLVEGEAATGAVRASTEARAAKLTQAARDKVETARRRARQMDDLLGELVAWLDGGDLS